MAQPPRNLLGRLSAALGLSAWVFAVVVAAIFGGTLRALAADVPVHDHTLQATESTRQMGMTVTLMNDALEGWAVGAAVLGLFGVGAVLALLGVESGRRAMASTGACASAAAGTTAGGLYLCCLASLIGLGIMG